MEDNSQLKLDLDPLPTFDVGCRVGGEVQVFQLEAVDYKQARLFVQEEVKGAKPVLAIIQGGKNNG